MTVLAAGQHIADRYQLDRRIAVGGMGEVWEASDNRLGRSVAVKVLRAELSADQEFLHRFRIEARTVASLDHPGIAAVHDYGEDDGPGGRRTAYLVMELVRGEPLSTLIARGPIEPDETLRLVEEAAWALQAAHDRGFVHRDVKPGNILVRTDGQVKLTDFGIAKAANAASLTRSGMVMGTAHYIAPEQASGSEAGPAGDVYSLGIVGYECLAGHRPFRAESAVAVAMMQVRELPPPLPPTVPLRARELIEAVLVKDPGLRYGTGGEFAAAVAAVRRGEPLPVPTAISGAAPVVPARSSAAPPRAERSAGGSRRRAKSAQGKSAKSPAKSPAKPPAKPPANSPAQPPAQPPPSPEPEPPPSRVPTRDDGAVGQTGAARRTAAPTPPPGPLHLAPTSGPSRALLLVLFLLLTVAAVVVLTFVLQGLRADPDQAEPAPRSAPTTSVPAGTGGVVAAPAAPSAPSPVIVIGAVR